MFQIKIQLKARFSVTETININHFFKFKYRKKEEHREKMMAYLGAMLKQQVEDEDFRIAKEVAKNEARVLREEQLKDMKFKQDMDEINKHRIETV